MNAFPPEKLVKRGAYQWLRHPIYWGFGCLVAGAFVLINSSSGLWMITPMTALGMLAIILGYELPDMKERFGNIDFNTYLDLPKKKNEIAPISNILSGILWILLLLFSSNYILFLLTREVQPVLDYYVAIDLNLDSFPIHLFSLLFIILTPVFLKNKELIREWIIYSLIGLFLSFYLAVLWPAIGAQYILDGPFTNDGLFNYQSIFGSIPIFLLLISLRSYNRKYRKLRPAIFIFALGLCFYQVYSCKSPLSHIITGTAIYLISISYQQIWELLRKGSEKIANSWKEWVFGPIRIINHGFYVGFGTFFGIFLAGYLSGKEYAWGILVFALVVIIFSALWAQIIEGSEKLKRPFGYYGALVGIIFASAVVWLMGLNVWVIIGVISVVMPWVQAIGRFRCLINGCCHGNITDNALLGIRYTHYRSRVCNISGLKGEALHPTPLYAILWLFFIGFILLRIWQEQLPYSFIFGIYLLLTGIGRFVEEAYRGEVQTPIIKGLRLYQWTAISTVIIGIVMTIIDVEPIVLNQGLEAQTYFAALLGGLFTLFVMGIDFPNSNRRFSRLV
jgi:prolipoprotein diacylglyceryltransferase